MMGDIGWVDISLMAILAISVVVGLVRGLVFEVLSLLGWVAAYFAAQWFAPMLGPHLPFAPPGSALQHGVAFALTFILALIIWGLGVRLISMLIKASPLSGFDRLLGAVFGLLRGVVLLLVIVTLVGYTPWARSPAWQASVGVVWLEGLRQQLLALLPPGVVPRLPASRGSDV